MKNPVLIFGATPLGRMAKEIFESNQVIVYGFLDDHKALQQTELDDTLVLGEMDNPDWVKLIGKKCESFVAIDDIRVRKNIVKMLKEERHVQPVNAIHIHAIISKRASIGHGNFIDAGCFISVASALGNYCLVNTQVSIGAEVTIGDYVQIGTGCNINSNVVIEDDVFIGSGVTIVAGVTIGKGARVGAGSVVISAVKNGETVFGNPAQIIHK